MLICKERKFGVTELMPTNIRSYIATCQIISYIMILPKYLLTDNDSLTKLALKMILFINLPIASSQHLSTDCQPMTIATIQSSIPYQSYMHIATSAHINKLAFSRVPSWIATFCDVTGF